MEGDLKMIKGYVLHLIVNILVREWRGEGGGEEWRGEGGGKERRGEGGGEGRRGERVVVHGKYTDTGNRK